MKISIICENKVGKQGAKYCLAEWGFSAFIQLANFKILFDTGHTGIYKHNAEQMGIDIQEADAVAISHHHWYHIGGLYHHNFISKKPLYMHNDVMDKVNNEERTFIENNFELRLSKVPIEMASGVWFLGEIPRKTRFEKGKYRNDKMLDDSALAIETSGGTVVISGCAHAGICNICEHAKNVTNSSIYAVVGGFHLFNSDKAAADATIEYFAELNPKFIHPMHCIDFPTMTKFRDRFGIDATHTGDELIFEE